MKTLRIAAILFSLFAAASGVAVADTVDALGGLRANIEQNSKLKDMRATVSVVQSNRKELEKMGKTFAEGYQFKKATVAFKCPDKFKVNGTLGMVKAEFITTGTKRIVRIPSMKMKKIEDISDEVQKRMTSLDVGVVSPSIWQVYKIALERTESNEQGKVYVLELTTDGSKKSQLVWVTEVGHKLIRRDRLQDDGSIKVKTVYSGHKDTSGVWVPTKAEVYNGDGKLAAVTDTKDIVVNAGIDDKEFE